MSKKKIMKWGLLGLGAYVIYQYIQKPSASAPVIVTPGNISQPDGNPMQA